MCYIKNHQRDSDGNNIKILVWSNARQSWAGVAKATRKKEDDIESGTFQIIEDGDIVLVSRHDATGEIIVSAEYVDKAGYTTDGDIAGSVLIAPNNNVNLGYVFQNVTMSIWDWLIRLNTDGDGFLPAGAGWDGTLTLYDQRKRDKIKTLLYGVKHDELLTSLVNAGQISNGAEVPNNWDEAEVLPYGDDVTVPVQVVSNHTKEVFLIQWFKDNITQVSTFTDISDLRSISVEPTATKVLIGELNVTEYSDQPLTRWRLYRR